MVKQKNWHFRENTARKKSNSKKGSHPALIVGIDNDSYANIGLTNQKSVDTTKILNYQKILIQKIQKILI